MGWNRGQKEGKNGKGPRKKGKDGEGTEEERVERIRKEARKEGRRETYFNRKV